MAGTGARLARIEVRDRRDSGRRGYRLSGALQSLQHASLSVVADSGKAEPRVGRPSPAPRSGAATGGREVRRRTARLRWRREVHRRVVCRAGFASSVVPAPRLDRQCRARGDRDTGTASAFRVYPSHVQPSGDDVGSSATAAGTTGGPPWVHFQPAPKAASTRRSTRKSATIPFFNEISLLSSLLRPLAIRIRT
jgi:hypothetical protein